MYRFSWNFSNEYVIPIAFWLKMESWKTHVSFQMDYFHAISLCLSTKLLDWETSFMRKKLVYSSNLNLSTSVIQSWIRELCTFEKLCPLNQCDQFIWATYYVSYVCHYFSPPLHHSKVMIGILELKKGIRDTAIEFGKNSLECVFVLIRHIELPCDGELDCHGTPFIYRWSSAWFLYFIKVVQSSLNTEWPNLDCLNDLFTIY